jgi:hypothetical protein
VSEPPSPIGRLPAKVIFLMAAASAMAVATIYYNQLRCRVWIIAEGEAIRRSN